MNDPRIFAWSVEAFFHGGEKPFVEAGSHLVGRFMRAMIVAHEVSGKGERVFVVRGAGV